MATVRRRRGEGENGEGILLLDEQEQEELANSLEGDAKQQLVNIERAFGLVCFTAATCVLSIPMVVGHGWWHAVISAALHVFSAFFVRFRRNDLWLVVPTLLPILYLFQRDEFEHSEFHWGIVLTNVIMGGGSIFLRHDRINTLAQIDEMQASKYKFKDI